MTSSVREPERIVVGIDGSTPSRAAVRWAIGHARQGDTITLVHAWQASPAMVNAGLVDSGDDSAARALAQYELTRAAALPREQGVTLACDVHHGDARQCLTNCSADLLVVGARGHNTSLLNMLLGSVSGHLAGHCPTPLVIVPDQRRPGGPSGRE